MDCDEIEDSHFDDLISQSSPRIYSTSMADVEMADFKGIATASPCLGCSEWKKKLQARLDQVAELHKLQATLSNSEEKAAREESTVLEQDTTIRCLQEELKQLQDEMKGLVNASNELLIENGELSTRKEELITENEEMNAKNKEWRTQAQESEKSINSLAKTNHDLLREIQPLQGKVEQLAKDKLLNTAEITIMAKTNQASIVKIQNLQEELKTAQEKIKSLESVLDYNDELHETSLELAKAAAVTEHNRMVDALTMSQSEAIAVNTAISILLRGNEVHRNIREDMDTGAVALEKLFSGVKTDRLDATRQASEKLTKESELKQQQDPEPSSSAQDSYGDTIIVATSKQDPHIDSMQVNGSSQDSGEHTSDSPANAAQGAVRVSPSRRTTPTAPAAMRRHRAPSADMSSDDIPLRKRKRYDKSMGKRPKSTPT